MFTSGTKKRRSEASTSVVLTRRTPSLPLPTPRSAKALPNSDIYCGFFFFGPTGSGVRAKNSVIFLRGNVKIELQVLVVAPQLSRRREPTKAQKMARTLGIFFNCERFGTFGAQHAAFEGES